MDDPQDLVSVYQAANPTEAHLVMNLLLDEDIDAQVSEENEPFAGLPVVPPDVLVRKADEALRTGDCGRVRLRAGRAGGCPDWTCPQCKATVVGPFDECDVCGAPRPGTEDA